MLVVDKVEVRPLTTQAAEISWKIVPTNEPLVQTRFHVLRSESPNGPYQDISGPLANTFLYLDEVNLTSKFDNISWRIRADHLPSGVSVTYPVGTPDESFIFHPELDRAAMVGDYGPDYIALDIVRRNNLLLKRFTGRLMAFFPAIWQGQRCARCWDGLKKRKNSSACNECYGTSFQGGYLEQINVFIDANPSPNIVQISNFGRIEANSTIMFMSNFPLAKPDDLLVERTNRRWRVTEVNTVTQKRYAVQQTIRVEEVDRSDSEFLLPVDLSLKAPPEDFVGFFPKKFSPKAVRTEGSGLL